MTRLCFRHAYISGILLRVPLKVGDKSLRAMTAILYWMRCWTGNQWRDFSSDLAWTHLRCWQMTRATLFWALRSFSATETAYRTTGAPYISELQQLIRDEMTLSCTQLWADKIASQRRVRCDKYRGRRTALGGFGDYALYKSIRSTYSFNRQTLAGRRRVGCRLNKLDKLSFRASICSCQCECLFARTVRTNIRVSVKRPLGIIILL